MLQQYRCKELYAGAHYHADALHCMSAFHVLFF
jgi:hypothetical protein